MDVRLAISRTIASASAKTKKETQQPIPNPTFCNAFTVFPNLPAELRLKIWRASFTPRIIQIHTPAFGSHHARDQPTNWQSQNLNPVGLAVNSEARVEALGHYSVVIPLHGNERPLYLNPAADTLVILGDLDYGKMNRLFNHVRAQDPSGRGLQRVGMSLKCWSHEFTGAILGVWSKDVFRELESFVLVMYSERFPPSEFRKRGGECFLEDCEGMAPFLRFITGQGRLFRRDGIDEGRFIDVGRTEMKIMNLDFVCAGSTSDKTGTGAV